MINLKNKKPRSAKQSDYSAKPLLAGIVLILVLIGLFSLKAYFLQKKNSSATNSNHQNQEELIVPLIEPEDVAKLILDKNYQLIDIREKLLFDEAHIESSINIPYSSIGENKKLFDKKKKTIIIDTMTSTESKLLTNHLKEEGFDVRLLSGGLDRYYLKNLPVISFGNPDSIQDNAKGTPITAAKFNERVLGGEFFYVVDVRPAKSFKSSHIEGAINIPLEELEKRKKDIPKTKVVVCDDDPIRSFQAAVKLYDMNIWGAYYLSDSLEVLKQEVQKQPTPAPSAPTNTTN